MRDNKHEVPDDARDFQARDDGHADEIEKGAKAQTVLYPTQELIETGVPLSVFDLRKQHSAEYDALAAKAEQLAASLDAEGARQALIEAQDTAMDSFVVWHKARSDAYAARDTVGMKIAEAAQNAMETRDWERLLENAIKDRGINLPVKLRGETASS